MLTDAGYVTPKGHARWWPAQVQQLLDDRFEQYYKRVADCWDNAVSESFFGTLKQELIFRCELQSRADAQTTIFEYLEVYYNPTRRHSTLGFLSPNDFEKRNPTADSTT